MLQKMAMCQRTWPDTHDIGEPPAGDRYRLATWLLGRYPRLANLANRVAGVVYEDDTDSELGIDLDHLADVFADAPRWGEAWDQYEARNPPPHDDVDYEDWRQRGPRPDDFALGLSDLLVMSSGEVASLRVLATLGMVRVPFKVDDLTGLDAEGQRLATDWSRAIARR
jgi:hypothetical protein